MTPFSLHDLGLTDEEIAMLGLGSDTQPAPEPAPAAEEALEPFSLDDLGIPSAIDPLDLADAAPSAPAEEQPALEPFSLSELGLTDEEIALLGLNDSPPAPTPAEEQPALEPFSLSDLGLADEEGAATGLEEVTPVPEAVEPPPVIEESPAPPAAPLAAEEAPPAPPPVAEAPPAPPAMPARLVQHAPVTMAAESGNPLLDNLARQVEAEPQNHVLRIALARVGGQVGMTDLALQQYRDLIKHGAMLDDVVADLGDLIAESEDDRVLRRLHKALGDAYTKQGRFAEAVAEYSWTGGGRGAG
jgi:hypothetical protein